MSKIKKVVIAAFGDENKLAIVERPYSRRKIASISAFSLGAP